MAQPPLVLRYGYGRFPWEGAPSWLIVVQGWEEEALGRWTNIPVLTLALAEFLLRCDLHRWRVEDASRGLKQGFQLEALRVRRWTAVRRLIVLASRADGFVGQGGVLPQRLVLVRCFRHPRKVIAYHFCKGLAKLWAGGLVCRPSFFG